MKPVLWVVAGVGTTIYGAIKVRRATEVFTADGARDRWQAISHGASLLAQDVRGEHHARKAELRQRYGMTPLTSTTTPALEDGQKPAEIDSAHTDGAHTDRETR